MFNMQVLWAQKHQAIFIQKFRLNVGEKKRQKYIGFIIKTAKNYCRSKFVLLSLH